MNKYVKFRRKRWWEFWKDDVGRRATIEIMDKMKEELTDGDIFLPTKEN